jgi:AcrR family transcriptional regulator
MTSRERILNAAVEILAKKGRHGARMEEIATAAKINKAMIYYIFRNKDELYFEVLKTIFSELTGGWITAHQKDIDNDKDPETSLVDEIGSIFSSFSLNANYTKILVDAVSNGAGEIPRAIRYCKDVYGEESFKAIAGYVKTGKELGVFRDVDVDQFSLSINGMIMIFFMTRALCEVLDIHVGDEKRFLEKRKDSIIDLMLHGILRK